MQNCAGKSSWDRVYRSLTESYQQGLLRFSSTPQWSYLVNLLYDYYGSLVGLRSIELGAGLAKASALLALHGVKPTLIDYSEPALEGAKKLLESIEQEADILCADALQLPEKLHSSFDISISVGTAEHFTGADREAFIKASYLTLKPGGMGIIIVPNSLCLRYNILMNLSAQFSLCLEKECPFTRRELSRLATVSGFSSVQVTGMNRKEAKERFQWQDLFRDLINRYQPWLSRLFPKFKGAPAVSVKASSDFGLEMNELLCRLLQRPRLRLSNRRENLFGYALAMKGIRANTKD